MVTKKVEPIGLIKTDDKTQLEDKLLKLQKGYCERDEIPSVSERVFKCGNGN